MTTITKSFTLLQCQLMVGVSPCTFSYYCTFEIFHCVCVVGVVVVGFTFCYHFHCRYLYLITTTLLHSLCVECLFVVIPCTTGSNAQKMPHTKCKRKTIECNERRIAFAQRSDEMLQLKENNSQSETKPNREKKVKIKFRSLIRPFACSI